MEDPPARHGCAEAAPNRMPQPADMLRAARGGGATASELHPLCDFQHRASPRATPPPNLSF